MSKPAPAEQFAYQIATYLGVEMNAAQEKKMASAIRARDAQVVEDSSDKIGGTLAW